MITEWVMSAGDWQLRLKDDCPQDVLDLFDTWDHVVISDQWVDPARFSDAQLKAMARWAGVLLELPRQGEGRDIAGLGLALHLGDADGVGDIFETAVTNTAETFPNWIRDLLPPGGAITEGTLASASGTLTATVQWVTPRQAIDWICGQFSQPGAAADVEWRVNPDGTLDAGTQADLWITGPASETLPPLLVARDPGSQPNAHAIPVADLAGQNEAYMRLLKQWVHGQGEGETLITGSATVASALKDYHGNDLVRTRVTPDSQATTATIGQRAGWLLRSHNHTHQRWEATLADFSVQGQFRPGDWILLYDQEAGFTDTACQMDYRGDRIWPEAVRVVGWTWAVSDGMGVYLRHRDGTWTDLTPYLEMEQPSTKLMLGDRPVESVTTDLTGQFLASHYTSDTAEPNLPTSLSATADTYINARGHERAWIVPTWTNPTLNTDGSTLTDLDVIQLRFRRNGTSEEWEYRDFPSTGSGAVAIRRLDPDTVYELQAQARRKNGNLSGWTSSATIDTAYDTSAPAKPPTPTLDVTNPLRIKVSVDLTTWGPANPDVVKFTVWGNTTSDSGTATTIGRILVSRDELAAEDTVFTRIAMASGVLGSAYYVWVKARDEGGNVSAFSDPASATPGQIETPFIEDAAVTGPKLGDGDVVALLTLSSTGKIRTAASGQRIEITAADGDRITFYSGEAGETVAAYIQTMGISGDPVLVVGHPNLAYATIFRAGTLQVGADPSDAHGGIHLGHDSSYPAEDNTHDLGTAAYTFKDGFFYGIKDEAGNRVIVTSKYTTGLWTPTWAGGSSNPTMSHSSGQYVRSGYVCQAWSVDVFTAVGSGFYSITLPVDASSSLTAVAGSCSGSVIGTFSLRDADTGINYTGTVHLAGISGTDTAIFSVTGDDARMGATTPITFAADDIVMVNLNYPVD